MRWALAILGVISMILAPMAGGAAATEMGAKKFDNWHHWRGPNCDGTSPNAEPPLEWSTEENVKWKVAVPGEGQSTPIVWENRIFILSAVPAAKDEGASGPNAGGDGDDNGNDERQFSILEPDPQQCEKFVSQLQSAGDRDIRVAAHNTRFEEFTPETLTGAKSFDLVLMVHSLYYMDDPQQALENALGLVGDSGRLVILIASNDQLNELSSSFWGMENGDSTWFSEDLSRHLEQSGVTFERQRIEAKLDITSCFEPDSEHGKRVADFVAQVSIGELPPRLQEMIFGYLETTSRTDGDKRWLPHNVDAFVIN